MHDSRLSQNRRALRIASVSSSRFAAPHAPTALTCVPADRCAPNRIGSRAAVTVYVQNVFGEDYYTGTQENFGLSGIRLKPHPRTFGANVSFKF